MVFEAIPFPSDAMVFMLPKDTVRHPTEGDCPFLVQRPHWRRGYIKSQPHGPRQSLRKIICISRTEPGAVERRPIFVVRF
jgi:hypothetical protein